MRVFSTRIPKSNITTVMCCICFATFGNKTFYLYSIIPYRYMGMRAHKKKICGRDPLLLMIALGF